MSDAPAPRPRAHRRAWIWWSAAALVLLLVLAGVWIAVRALLAKGELEAAVPVAERVQASLLAGDAAAASADAADLADRTASAASLTGDPIWRAAEVLPWLGPNLRTMRVLAASVDDAARDAIQPLAAEVDALGPAVFAPEGGALDLAPLEAAREPVAAAAASVAHAREAVDAVAGHDVIGPLAEARERVAGLLGQADDGLDALDRALRLVPPMLGEAGPRNILVLVQNPAELRSTGGIPGSLLVIRTEGGAFELAGQASASEVGRFDPPVGELDTESRALWGENPTRYLHDVAFLPDFAKGAAIAREMWAGHTGVAVDSVVAVDPVVLALVLEATGPVAMPGGEELTADNAVRVLLQDVYARYPDPAAQDAYFAAAAQAVVARLAAGGVDPQKLLTALVRAGEERRIFVWNTDPAEQDVIAGTGIAGGLPGGPTGGGTGGDASTAAFGVYLNDLTGSKMDTYLHVEIASGTRVCRGDGLARSEVQVTLENTAPADAATSLPEYVTGGGAFGVPAGEISTSVHVYGEPGAYNLGVLAASTGEPVGYHPTSDAGYTLSKIVVQLAPGERASYRFGFLAGAPGVVETAVQATPTGGTIGRGTLALACDSPYGEE
ncbi:DUF4012 domain-containing protein [Agromyces archimandritae]|uniref:DUF4012 domain-containing protein n=1 Tax=Agromyces archimandritae TaxID=2781962 RepID=A0A975IP98_9MICO|nr:DUF4012 domain-containing protein [Agromyces archimandritae]QTX05423.1 DUF4012 domain-containing protein [Agromyces archimandritae]